MAVETWNRVNIPFPGANLSVRIPFDSHTDISVSTVLAENENVLKLLRSEILETEIRVLYELLYVLNNSSRASKTFKALKQVEQCIHRLQRMKLTQAFDDLEDVCPTKGQRAIGMNTGQCDLPSQPLLEWVCLKVLGAAQLMSCTMDRCSRAFILSRQHMKGEEFIILNWVITSLLSRLWVIFRGILMNLSTLYKQILELLSKVSLAKPTPFLTDFSLPADVAKLLGPVHASLLLQKDKQNKEREEQRRQRKKKKDDEGVRNHRQKGRVEEDLGVAIKRDIHRDYGMKPFLEAFKIFQQRGFKDDKTKAFEKQVQEATTFADMATHLDGMIKWCKSQKKEKERRLLIYLRVKCIRMKGLEAAGYSLQKKLKRFRQEAIWASSPQSPAPRICPIPCGPRKNGRYRTKFHSLRRYARFSKMRSAERKKQSWTKIKELSASGPSEESQKIFQSAHKTAPQTSDSDDKDDIDDIFSSIGI